MFCGPAGLIRGQHTQSECDLNFCLSVEASSAGQPRCFHRVSLFTRFLVFVVRGTLPAANPVFNAHKMQIHVDGHVCENKKHLSYLRLEQDQRDSEISC